MLCGGKEPPWPLGRASLVRCEAVYTQSRCKRILLSGLSKSMLWILGPKRKKRNSVTLLGFCRDRNCPNPRVWEPFGFGKIQGQTRYGNRYRRIHTDRAWRTSICGRQRRVHSPNFLVVVHWGPIAKTCVNPCEGYSGFTTGFQTLVIASIAETSRTIAPLLDAFWNWPVLRART